MTSTSESTSEDTDLAALLADLSDVQHELLTVLGEKRAALMTANTTAMAALAPREADLIARLQACQDRRASLLAATVKTGETKQSLRELAASMPSAQRRQFEPQIQSAASQSRLLQHQSLTNWVVVQRTLIHLSQMLEIIATGGRLRPTYGTGTTTEAAGNLVDQEA